MPSTSRTAFLDEIVLRLQRITVANGFNYTIPNNTKNVSWKNFKHWNDISAFPAAFVLVERTTFVGGQTGYIVRSEIPLFVWGYVKATSNAALVAEAFLNDLFEAVFTHRTNLVTDATLNNTVPVIEYVSRDVFGDLESDIRVVQLELKATLDHSLTAT